MVAREGFYRYGRMSCQQCGKELVGRQRKWCSDACGYRANRHIYYNNRATKRKTVPGYERGCRIRHRFNMGLDDYDRMYQEQQGRCAICGKEEELLDIDHDHRCCPVKRTEKTCGKCVRGLLCGACNRGIGLFNDDPVKLEAAAAYVRGTEEND